MTSRGTQDWTPRRNSWIVFFFLSFCPKGFSRIQRKDSSILHWLPFSTIMSDVFFNCLFQNMYNKCIYIYTYIHSMELKMDRKVHPSSECRQALRRNEALVANFWELRRRADIYYARSPTDGAAKMEITCREFLRFSDDLEKSTRNGGLFSHVWLPEDRDKIDKATNKS